MLEHPVTPTVSIHVESGQASGDLSTSFFINEHGTFVSCAHLINPDATHNAAWIGGELWPFRPVYQDKETDLFIGHVPEAEGTPHYRLRDCAPRSAEPVKVPGYDHEFDMEGELGEQIRQRTQRLETRKAQIEQEEFDLSNVPGRSGAPAFSFGGDYSAGFSGSPVLGRNDDVVGMVLARYDNWSEGVALSSQVIVNALNQIRE